MKAGSLDVNSCLILLMTIVFSTKVLNEYVDVRGKTLSRSTDKGMAYANFQVHKLSYLNITSIGSAYVLKGSECVLACVNTASCFSFNMAAFPDNSGKVLCELLPSDMYNNSDKLVVSQHFHHFSITSPCISWPCQNNGTCAAQYEKNSYVCVCTKGYTGKNCEIEPLSVIICEGNTQSITCSSGSTLDVLEAMYGRQDSYTCAGVYNTTDCRAENSSSVVYNRCQNKGSCLLKATNLWFGDPCYGTTKYLFVKYHCMN